MLVQYQIRVVVAPAEIGVRGVAVPGGDTRRVDVFSVVVVVHVFSTMLAVCYSALPLPHDAASNCTPVCNSPLSPSGPRRPLPRCGSGGHPPVRGGRISQAWAVGEPASRARPLAPPACLPG